LNENVVLPFPELIRPIQNVRSTLLQGGLASLFEAGLKDAYLAVVPPEVRSVLESAVAGMWIPVETALGHYLACDRLGLSSESVVAIGRGTFERTKGLLLGTAVGLAKSVGVTPWSLVPHMQRFWLRGNDGGGVRAVKLGPKEVRIEVVATPLFRSRYYCAAYRGIATSLFELVAQKAYTHEIRRGRDEDALSIRVQWV
jgi:hypothetical protein